MDPEKNQGRIILPDVSLCSIVRDEKMNPAGGIERFVKSHVPFVEEAVIVDTGSLDGTREILEELQGRYGNLRVYDHKFKGFADARNFSMQQVKTEYALILDADELITHKKPNDNWKPILEALNSHSHFYRFGFRHLTPSGYEGYPPTHYIRLVRKKACKFERNVFEHISGYPEGDYLDAFIMHFLPSERSSEIKNDHFYFESPSLTTSIVVKKFTEKIIKKHVAPSQIEGFSEWKSYNPQRDLYK